MRTIKTGILFLFCFVLYPIIYIFYRSKIPILKQFLTFLIDFDKDGLTVLLLTEIEDNQKYIKQALDFIDRNFELRVNFDRDAIRFNLAKKIEIDKLEKRNEVIVKTLKLVKKLKYGKEEK